MILHRYFAIRFAKSFGMIFGLFLMMIGFFDLVDQLGRHSKGSDATFSKIVGLTLLNVPYAIYTILPLIMILASILLFLGLARSSEMVVTRAAGRSALRALLSPIFVTLLIGVVGVAVFNPIVAATSKEYESRSNAMRGESAVLSISSDGLWLRQGSDVGQTVIRAQASNLDGTRLSDVTFLTFGFGTGPTRRIEAQSATLENGQWTMQNAKVWTLLDTANPEVGAQTVAEMSIPSSLTADQIRDSFGQPSSVSIWDLPGFISQLKRAGFSARRHEVWFQSELSKPVFLIAMVLIGAAFTMRHQRGGKTGIMVLTAVILSFALYFVRNFANILGETGQLPVALAVWAPPLAAIGMSLGLILHLEDG